jgi:hypothetical protein
MGPVDTPSSLPTPGTLTLSSSVKEHELRQAVGEREAHLVDISQSLAEYKHRALQAEVCISNNARFDLK